MADVAVYGTVAADLVMRVAQLPRPGDHIAGEALGWRLGGSSANIACGLAAAGHNVQLVGPVGNDAMATTLVSELGRRGVRTDYVLRVDAPAPRALILLDADGERAIVGVEDGVAMSAFPIDDPPDAGDVDCIYVESYERFSKVIAERSRRALIAASPPATSCESWPADILVGSEHQYPATWLTSPFESAAPVAGPRLRWVVVTRGRNGADAFGPSDSCHVAARSVQQVDATGAGDAFAAGLVAGLLAQRGIRQAMALGVDQGAAAVEFLQSVPPERLTDVARR